MSLVSAGFISHSLNAIVIFLGFLLICIVLIQQGKGGGLTGAFGGMGGATPFGSKSADTITRLTAYMAIAWAACILFQVYAAKLDGGRQTAVVFDLSSK